MKQLHLFFIVTVLFLFSFNGINIKNSIGKEKAIKPPFFSNVVYTGDDIIYKANVLKSDEFYSPILQGCYPDPAITRKGKDTYILMERTEKGVSKIIASTKIEIKNTIRLQVKAIGDSYKFSYAFNSQYFKNLGGTVSGDILSTNMAGGFTGALLGLYATSSNDAQIK